MQDINIDMKSGTVTKDSELREIPKGQGETVSMLRFSIAVHGYKDAVSYFNVEVWGKLAELLHDKVLKGVKVTVIGEGQNRTYDNPNTGQRVTTHSIKVTSGQHTVQVHPKATRPNDAVSADADSEFVEVKEEGGIDLAAVFNQK